MNGYQGKILCLDLTKRTHTVIDTAGYVEWGGGHGIGSRLFWDLCEDKTVHAFDPKNVVTIMTSPLSGTMVPSASGRVEVQGISPQQYPQGWFSRSNFGGRFGGQLKYAGWDGIAILGKADKPVWVEIINDQVVIKDAGTLWGKDTQETQKTIWAEQRAAKPTGRGWTEMGGRDAGRTVQKSAILTIGPAGESQSSFGCLIHDAGNAAGQCGYGAVFGSKNLKAISVIGTGSIEIADAEALMGQRLEAKQNYANLPEQNPAPIVLAGFGIAPKPGLFYGGTQAGGSGPQACQGCINGCRARFETGIANEETCEATGWYTAWNVLANGAVTPDLFKATDLIDRLGINTYETEGTLKYLYALYKKGLLGPGKEIDTDLKMDRIGQLDFIEDFLDRIANRKEIGEELAEGCVRASVKWGRYEQDSADGSLGFPYWGMVEHTYDPRLETEWGYGTLMGDRDINEHSFNWLMWNTFGVMGAGAPPSFSAEEWAKIVTDKMAPYAGDMEMQNYATENMYSEHMAKLVSWHRHYTRFWLQSALFCEWRYPDFINVNREDKVGLSGKTESEFWKAVTGSDVTWEQGIELGRKIWNLDNAIWTLQGRTRDMAKFATYIYEKPAEEWHMGTFYPMPIHQNGKWEYLNVIGRNLDEAKVEEWKTLFYKLEGWDPKTGWPTRKTLEGLGLSDVAAALEKTGKLGDA